MSNLTSKSIVDSSVALLTGRTAAGDRVYPWKTSPVQTEQLPCIVVSASRASETVRSLTSNIYEITTVLSVECHAKGTSDDDWSSATDVTTDRVKRALLTDKGWNDQFRSIDKVETTIGQSVDGDYRRIVAIVEFSCTHDVEYEPLEDEVLVDLTTVHYTDEALTPQEMEANLAPEEVDP